MSRNLFVAHTQNNLVTIIGIVKKRFPQNGKNDLILFQDFFVGQDLEHILNEIFDNVYMFHGSILKKKNSYLYKLYMYNYLNSTLKKNIKTPYNNVFLILDYNYPEMLIIKLTNLLSKDTTYYWIEDGSTPYFKINVKNKGLGSNRYSLKFREIIFKYLLNLKEYYHYDKVPGQHFLITKQYVSFPRLVTNEYRNKETLKISNTIVTIGINSVFQNISRKFKSKSALILLDKLERYDNKNEVIKLYDEISKNLVDYGYDVYYKYHPREEEEIEVLKKNTQLNKNVAIEAYYPDLDSQHSIVIGTSTNGLQTAVQMNIKTFSLIKILNYKDKELVNFYEEIGIVVPKDSSSLLNQL